jgi:hypothetical protein
MAPGVPPDIALDISALGSFQSGSVWTIDANTSVTSGSHRSLRHAEFADEVIG